MGFKAKHEQNGQDGWLLELRDVADVSCVQTHTYDELCQRYPRVARENEVLFLGNLQATVTDVDENNGIVQLSMYFPRLVL